MSEAATLSSRLRALFPEASGRSLKQWLESGRIELNGRVCRDGRIMVGAKDRVVLGTRGRVPFPRGLGLVHEDAAVVVVDKQPGLLSMATERERERTAYRLLWDYLAAQRPRARPFIVHRLDRETSGLLVFAKSEATKRHLQAQFEARTVERVYVALVRGKVRRDAGTLESRLVEDKSLRVHATAGPEGKTAITSYRVIGHGQDTTLLELSLGTGRRRQIRVQLAAIGHPIVGDREHGGPSGPFRRLCLHARRLGFVHPTTGKPMRFDSAAPEAWV
ncbi:MAG TPA: RluA family pseudouridine synthase [Candidatus Eisenbacteria bacterium]|nr:RluA family pseudouridine synthase [Candidatus Eisenbacteria bacterium]